MKLMTRTGRILLLAQACLLAGENVSRVPQLYIISYRAENHLAKPELLDRLRGYSLDLYHAGKDGPFVHNWGPIAGWGGENVSTGRDHDAYRRLLSPTELDERFETCRRYVKAVHNAGVRRLYHYVCGFTIGGDPKTRHGFWGFYDRWDDYARFGIGPKPPADPLDWMMRNHDGSLCFIYGREYESYKPGTRWAACMNNPYWRQWMKAVFRASASVGFDGIFPDNCFNRCYCERCRAEFAKFVRRENRPSKAMATFAQGGRAWFDTQEFWVDTIARWMEDMRAEARTINPEFGIFPNNGTHPGYRRFSTACDYMMGEGDFWGFGARGFGTIWFHKDPGLLRQPLVSDLAFERRQDLIISYKYTAAEGGRPSVVWLTHGHQGKSLDAMELRFCEAMAFGAGACTFGRPSTPPEMYARYRRFFTTRKRLYDGLAPMCRVGLAYFPRQAFHKNMQHVQFVWDLASSLNAQCIPYRVVTETDCRSADLGDLSIIFLPAVDHIELAELRALRAFLRRGGTLVCHQGPPRRDEHYRELPPSLRLSEDAGRVVSIGGKVRETEVLESCRHALQQEPRATETPYVCCEVRHHAADRRVVVHLVNYNVALGKPGAKVTPATDVVVRIPTPKAWHPGTARLHDSHSDAAQTLPLHIAGNGQMQVTVSTLGIYAVIEVTQ